MGRVVTLVLLAACGARSPATVGPPPAPRDGGAAVLDAAPVVVTPPPPAAPAPTAPHLAEIATLALSRRGDAVVSVDLVGEVRLWPALDGSAPPVALAAQGLTAPRIERRADRLLVGGRLPAGLGYLAHLRAGALAEVTLDSLDGEVVAVVPLADATTAVVARADQTLALVDAAGVELARVELAGERLRALVAVEDGVLAVVRRADERYLARRYRPAAGGLAAGAEVALPIVPVDGAPLALSPDGALLAVLAEPGSPPTSGPPAAGPPASRPPVRPRKPPPPPPAARLAILDLATGVERPARALGDTGRAPAILGFLDAHRLVLADAAGRLTVTLGDDDALATEPVGNAAAAAATAGVLVAASGGGLQVAPADAPARYLGYRITSARSVALSPAGARLAVLGGAGELAVESLADGTQWLSPVSPLATALVGFLDEDRLLSRETPTQLVLRDVQGGAELGAAAIPASVEVLLHPGRRWLFGRGDGGCWAARVDLTGPRIERPRVVDPGCTALGVVDRPGSPVVLATVGGGRLRAFTAGDLDGAVLPGVVVEGGTPQLVAADQLGTFYGASGDQLVAVALDGTARRAVMPGAAFQLLALPDGGVVWGSPALSAFDAEGALRWHLSGPAGARQLSASADRTRLAVMASEGTWLVDPATGARLHATCAWGFGAWDVPPGDGLPGVVPLCP